MLEPVVVVLECESLLLRSFLYFDENIECIVSMEYLPIYICEHIPHFAKVHITRSIG